MLSASLTEGRPARFLLFPRSCWKRIACHAQHMAPPPRHSRIMHTHAQKCKQFSSVHLERVNICGDTLKFKSRLGGRTVGAPDGLSPSLKKKKTSALRLFSRLHPPAISNLAEPTLFKREKKLCLSKHPRAPPGAELKVCWFGEHLLLLVLMFSGSKERVCH